MPVNRLSAGRREGYEWEKVSSSLVKEVISYSSIIEYLKMLARVLSSIKCFRSVFSFNL